MSADGYVYQVLWTKVCRMIKAGEFKFDGKLTAHHWDDLDKCLFKIFHVKTTNSDIRNYDTFNTMAELGRVDVRWIYGPHAATLLKAKIIKEGYSNGGKESGNKGRGHKGRDKKRHTGRVTKAAKG